MHKSLILSFLLLWATAVPAATSRGSSSVADNGTRKQPVDYVNPFIGTTNFGTCNPGAICPRGMMSVTPFNVMGDSKANVINKDSLWWSTPYEIRNRFLTGFAHVNLSGVGCPEMGSLLLMPTAGALDVVSCCHEQLSSMASIASSPPPRARRVSASPIPQARAICSSISARDSPTRAAPR